ncbi:MULTISPECIES: PTS sugar transporter subunit IIA [unclassified Streptococcus]|uniref:PTS sugar transporter subunit IIA n=1 Tax=unclassified Streptococcus TaxID=2608887 RepID=UPI001072E95C|nr:MULTISPECIES: PTS sugar transporter subunit IIA [unclassified Streptococcus]MBF0786651.1 PTS sugar transporter subunit IIA [Streptococcus sp. 19428wC2_LYSM12]MCQ9211726.1 PTS sugar transporter subunit IIA [Streptococcus sp. B01]MCQ9213085.1 PTS sugar transporter subunit IIA [Streptococcus sp. O1]TFV06404.1 PTS sugar transporter subunit IIA [Streptococcus sp. LYSM12]
MTAAIKLSDYLNEPLIFTQKRYSSNKELFTEVSTVAFDKGYVREDFLERVKQREETFPTGIQLEDFGVAIPHTDAECVHKEFVAIITNAEPVAFKSMEDLDQMVAANIVFVLGLNQPHAQLDMLQSLMKLLQNPEVLSQLLVAETTEQLLTIVKNNNL